MKIKRILAMILASSMVMAALAGCGSGNADTAAGTENTQVTTEDAAAPAVKTEEKAAAVKIQGMVAQETDLTGEFTYWSSFTGDSQVWDQSRVDLFNELYADKGIHCNVQFVPEGAGIGNGKLLSAIAGGQAPDLIISDRATDAYSYAANGSFEPIDKYLDEAGIKVDEFFEGCKDIIYYKEQAYLIPQDANVILLYYNPAIAAEVGLDPAKPPTTLEELDQWADAMTVQNDDGSYDRFGLIPWIDSGEEAFILSYLFGCDVYDAATNKLDLTSDEMVQYLEWVQGYAERYNPEKIASFTKGMGGMFSPDHAYMKQKVGMTITGNWFSNALKIYAPDVPYEVCAIPVPEGGRKNSTTFGTNVFGIPKGAKNPELAAFFMNFCLSAEVNEDNFSQWRSIPTSDAEFDKVSLTKNGDKMYLLEREIANSPDNGIPALCSVASEIEKTFRSYRESVIYGQQKDIKAGLQEMQDKFQKQLDAGN